jgi:hypothetical protein
MTQKANIASVVLIIALISSFYFFQNKIDALESQLSSTEIEAVEDENNIAPNVSPIESQLDDLNNQLIITRGELFHVQQKLILSASETVVLEDKLKQSNNNLKAIQPIKQELKDTKIALELSELELQGSNEKHSQLANSFITQNEVIINRSLDRIKLLSQTASGATMTVSAVPFVGVAALIVYTQDQTKKSCEEINAIIVNEQQIFGNTTSLTSNMLNEYESQCQ